MFNIIKNKNFIVNIMLSGGGYVKSDYYYSFN